MNKDVEKYIVIFILVIFAAGFFIKGQYYPALITLGLVVVLTNVERLKKFVLGKGWLSTEFYEIPEEKLKQDILENKKKVNKKTLINFKKIEEEALKHISAKINGVMKRQIHYVYGNPPNYEFAYTPDATFQTNDELIFVEIKYVSKPEYVSRILGSAVRQISLVLDKLGPSAGQKKLVAKVVLASNFFIDVSKLKSYHNIEVIHYQL
jgi:hypothetical protein